MSEWGQEETFVHRCLLGPAPALPAAPSLPGTNPFGTSTEQRAGEALPRQSLSYRPIRWIFPRSFGSLWLREPRTVEVKLVFFPNSQNLLTDV